MVEFKARLDSDHQWMTKAAVEALSAKQQRYLGDEAEALSTIYCEFPDMNWSCYGAWGGWSGNPGEPRLPDLRREWDISYYCQCDPLLGTGRFFNHAPPEACDAAAFYFEKAVESLRHRRFEDGARFLGVMAHYIQDSATFPHMQAIHRRMEGHDLSQISTQGYRPLALGGSVAQAKRTLKRRVQQMVHRTEGTGTAIRKAIRDGDRGKLSVLLVECDNEGAKATADAVCTALSLAGPKTTLKPNPFDVNLVSNPSLEDEADPETPQGWVIGWHDLTDRLGVAMWEGKVNRNSRVAHSGKGAVKLMWTPTQGLEWRQRWTSAIRVRPGERYRCSAWVRTEQATGRTYVALNLYGGNYEPVETHRGAALRGTCDWQHVAVEVVVPEGAKWARVALRSEANRGAAWFDDVEVVRLRRPPRQARSRREAASGATCEEETVLLLAFQEEGVHLQDSSPYGGLHSPIVSCSGSRLTDLHTTDRSFGRALAFDGKDDFVEVPFSRVQDVLSLTQEFSVILSVWADEKRDAYLLSRERWNDDAYTGFRLETGAEGKLRFHVSFGGSPQFVSAPYPVRQWTHIAATVDRSGKQSLYVNGRVAEEKQGRRRLVPAAESDLYIGSDCGVTRFFKGKVDRVRITKRAVSPHRWAIHEESEDMSLDSPA